MDQPTPPFLRNVATGAVFIATPELLARGDLQPCATADGSYPGEAPAPAGGEPEQVAASAPPAAKKAAAKKAAADEAPADEAPDAPLDVAPTPAAVSPEQFAAEVNAVLAAAGG